MPEENAAYAWAPTCRACSIGVGYVEMLIDRCEINNSWSSPHDELSMEIQMIQLIFVKMSRSIMLILDFLQRLRADPADPPKAVRSYPTSSTSGLGCLATTHELGSDGLLEIVQNLLFGLLSGPDGHVVVGVGGGRIACNSEEVPLLGAAIHAPPRIPSHPTAHLTHYLHPFPSSRPPHAPPRSPGSGGWCPRFAHPHPPTTARDAQTLGEGDDPLGSPLATVVCRCYHTCTHNILPPL